MINQQKRLAFGTGMLDWEERINLERMRRERPAKARAKLKESGFAAIILGLGDNRTYVTAVDPGGISAFVPGASGLSVLFTEGGDDTTIDYCVEGNCTRQAQIHTPLLIPENIRAVHSLNSNQRTDQVLDNAKKQAEELYQDLKAQGVEKEKIAYDGLNAVLLPVLKEKGLNLTAAPEVMVDARTLKTQMGHVACIERNSLHDSCWTFLLANEQISDAMVRF